MGLINWRGISSVKMLISSLKSFLDKVFGDKLFEEARKLKEWKPKGKLGSFEYLCSVKVHKATRWYWLLRDLEKRGYSFDLRFSSDIEEFMNLLLFAYSFDRLIQQNILSLDSSEVRGALMDRQRFESLTYEVLIAANYASSVFEVKLPDLLKIGRTDVYAKRGNVVVYAECKKLRRNERYAEVAINVMQELRAVQA